MQPNSNDPMGPGGQIPGTGQSGASGGGVPPQAPSVPDWQQGLGTNTAPAQVINPAAAPNPGASAPQNPAVPDWQQGLGTSATPTASAPTPEAPGGPAAGTPVVSQPVYDTMPGAGMDGAPASKRSLPKLVIAAAAVVVVLVLAAGGYFMFAKSGHQSAKTAARTSASKASKQATALDTLTSATLTAPTDMSGFEGDVGAGSNHSYPTTGSDTTNGGCELAFGTATPAILPGATIDDIVAPGIKSLKDSGISVNGPKAEAALILRDTAGKEYSLPTISYSFTQGTKAGKTLYSLAITKDGNRTYVRRDCAAVNGAVDSSKMNMLEQKAAQITVTAQ